MDEECLKQAFADLFKETGKCTREEFKEKINEAINKCDNKRFYWDEDFFYIVDKSKDKKYRNAQDIAKLLNEFHEQLNIVYKESCARKAKIMELETQVDSLKNKTQYMSELIDENKKLRAIVDIISEQFMRWLTEEANSQLNEGKK